MRGSSERKQRKEGVKQSWNNTVRSSKVDLLGTGTFERIIPPSEGDGQGGSSAVGAGVGWVITFSRLEYPQPHE
eukprot:752190-Hanusia_phi.AAC.6